MSIVSMTPYCECGGFSLAGVLMFNIGDGVNGGAPPSHDYYLWERGLFMGAVVLTAIGFVLLE